MVSLTLSVSEEEKSRLKELSWVNWSEIAREEATKKLIFDDFLITGKISDGDWKFCEKIDWHPTDELPFRDDFKKEIAKRKKGKLLKAKSVEELFK